MKLLLLGGTQFVGRWIAEFARDRGHEVTLFHRGRTNPDLFPDLDHVRGDRDGGLDGLRGRRWDAAIDVSGYVPRIVEQSSSLLAGAVDHLTFVSTGAVYASSEQMGQDEDSSLVELEDPEVEEITGATYGGLKVLCERVVEAHFPARNLILRPGVIVGPHDPTDRFTYWPIRIATQSTVLAPPVDATMEFTDVRDLAIFTLDAIERRLTGIFNISGPGERKIEFGDFLARVRAVLDEPGEVVAPSTEFLTEQGVGPWIDLPLWPWPDRPGLATRSIARAIGEGLPVRAVEETIVDTLDWVRRERGSSFADLRTGLDRDRERAILGRWRQRTDTDRESTP